MQRESRPVTQTPARPALPSPPCSGVVQGLILSVSFDRFVEGLNTLSNGGSDSWQEDMYAVCMSGCVGTNLIGLLASSLYILLLNSSPPGTAKDFTRRFSVVLWVPLANLIMGIIFLAIAMGLMAFLKYSRIWIALVTWGGASLLLGIVVTTKMYHTIHIKRGLVVTPKVKNARAERAAARRKKRQEAGSESGSGSSYSTSGSDGDNENEDKNGMGSSKSDTTTSNGPGAAAEFSRGAGMMLGIFPAASGAAALQVASGQLEDSEGGNGEGDASEGSGDRQSHRHHHHHHHHHHQQGSGNSSAVPAGGLAPRGATSATVVPVDSAGEVFNMNNPVTPFRMQHMEAQAAARRQGNLLKGPLVPAHWQASTGTASTSSKGTVTHVYVRKAPSTTAATTAAASGSGAGGLELPGSGRTGRGGEHCLHGVVGCLTGQASSDLCDRHGHGAPRVVWCLSS